MPKITYVTHDGVPHTVDAVAGQSAMEVAVGHNIPGIDGDCGGAVACGTCHVHVDDAWSEKAGAPAENEAGMLAYVDDARPNSRLCCQIRLTNDLDGLILHLPAAQH
ncbi:MAG: 2Fe-2S iron-sulfur cluster-binding protein [Zavarzinia sp.]|nr:2Fe-2S iron-sulfur cluster-binding protein [Zavarzinia sp.]